MNALETGCLAMVIKSVFPEVKLGEVVICQQHMPEGSVINNGRLGEQIATNDSMWWVYNNHGQWLQDSGHLVRLYDGDADDEMLKVTGKPPSHPATA